jgi:hypothetical protein
MGYSRIVRGHVGSIARVRIHLDEVPEGVVLAAGMTSTVPIDPRG